MFDCKEVDELDASGMTVVARLAVVSARERKLVCEGEGVLVGLIMKEEALLVDLGRACICLAPVQLAGIKAAHLMCTSAGHERHFMPPLIPQIESWQTTQE